MLREEVRLEFSKAKGRYLVADRDFSPGDVVVSQLPYGAVLFSEHITRFCNYCFREGEKLRRCSRSKFAHYCCKEHQLKDWQEGYKFECEFIRLCAPRRPPESARLAARVVWKRQSEIEQGIDTTDVWNTYHGVDLLDDHFDDLPSHRLQAFAEMGYFISKLCPYLPAEGFAFGESIEKSLSRLIAKFAFNNHTVSCSSQTSLGCGVYPLLAMVNHSDEPNCIQRFNDKLCQFRAICPIKAGDEITITYVDLASTTLERRDLLKESYLFDMLADVPVRKPNKTFKVNSNLVVEVWRRSRPSWLLSEKDDKLSEVVDKNGISGGLTLVAVPSDSKLLSDLSIVSSRNSSESTEDQKSTAPVVVHLWGNWVSGRFDAPSVGKKILEAHLMHREGKALIDKGNFSEAFSVLQKCLTLLSEPLYRDHCLPESHILRYKALDMALKSAIEVGNEWDFALQLARKIAKQLDIIYPEYWSEKSYQLAVLSKLESNYGDLKLAVEAAEEAVRSMRVTDGTGDVLESVKELLTRLKRELDYVCQQTIKTET